MTNTAKKTNNRQINDSENRTTAKNAGGNDVTVSNREP